MAVKAYRPDDGRTEDILPRGRAPDLVNAAWRDYGERVGAFRLLDRLACLGVRPALLLDTEVHDTAPAVVAAADFARAILDEFEEMRAFGEQAFVMSVVLHSFISGQPFSLRPGAEALARIVSGGDVWLATPREIHAAVLAAPERAAGDPPGRCL